MKNRGLSSQTFIEQLNQSTALFLAIGIAITLTISGCASTEEAATPFTPIRVAPSKSLIYLYRTNRFVGAVNKAEIFINNQYVGQLDNGAYCTFTADPGSIEIKALEKIPEIFVLRSALSKIAGKQPIFEFVAEPDRDYYLEFNVAGYKVKPVPKDKALIKMSGLPPAKFSNDQTDEKGAPSAENSD